MTRFEHDTRTKYFFQVINLFIFKYHNNQLDFLGFRTNHSKHPFDSKGKHV